MKAPLTTLICCGLLGTYWLISSSSRSTPSMGRASREAESQPAEPAPLQFHGYDCTNDCSGHEAGYQWAEEHEIADQDECGGNSESFIEGCKAYVEEQSSHDNDENDDMDSPSESEDSDQD